MLSRANPAVSRSTPLRRSGLPPAPAALSRAVLHGLRDPQGSTDAGTSLPYGVGPYGFGNQQGFGLTELLIVGAAAIAVAGASYIVYQKSDTAQRVTREVDNVGAVAENVVRMYSSRTGFSQLTNNNAIAGEMFPASLVSTTGSIRNAWGGSVTVAATPVSVGGAPASADQGFKITYNGVDSSACANFVSSAGPGFFDVLVAGTSVLNSANHNQIDTTATAQRCSSAPTATVEFVYGRASLGAPLSCTASLPPAEVQSQTYACPPGQLISSPGAALYAPSGPQTRQRSPFCNAGGTVDFGTWTAWSPTYTCAPVCATVTTPYSQPAPCPAGQVASSSPYGPTSGTQSRVGTRTCATPIGPLNPESYTPWSTTGQSCAPVCANTSGNESQAAPCPAGQLATTAPYGTTSGTQTRSWTATCTTPVGPLGAPNYTPWTISGQSCAPACTPTSGTESQPAPCPAGQVASTSPYGATSGTQTRSWTQSCTTPVGPLAAPVYTPWTITGQSCVPVCAPVSAPESQTGTCPAGQLSTTAPYGSSITQSRTRTQTCSTPIGPLAPPAYTAWTPTLSCAPACSTVNTPESQTATCPAGQSGSWTQTRTNTQTCSTPVGPLNPSTYTPWSPATAPAGTCTPVCGAAPAPASQSLTCPAGQTGTWTQQHGWTSAPSPTCWTAAPWSDVTNTCAPPSCPAAPSPAFQTRSPSCPAGQSGTWNQRRNWAASPYPSCGAWGTWFDTTNTCAPNTCPVSSPPSTTPACPSGGNQAGGSWGQSAFPSCTWSYNGGTCPTCPPAPAPVSQSLSCPSGQTGTWTQQRGWVSASYPTCWTAGSWTDTTNTCAPSAPTVNKSCGPATCSIVHTVPFGPSTPYFPGFFFRVGDQCSGTPTTYSCTGFANPSLWTVSWTITRGSSWAPQNCPSGSGSNYSCAVQGASCAAGTAQASVVVRYTPTGQTYNFSFVGDCELNHL